MICSTGMRHRPISIVVLAGVVLGLPLALVAVEIIAPTDADKIGFGNGTTVRVSSPPWSDSRSRCKAQ